MVLHAPAALEHIAQPSVTTVRVVAMVFSCLAIAITLFRLVIQYRRSQLWWEDVWATIAMVCETVAVPVLWVLGSAAAEAPSKKFTWILVNWLLNFPLTLSLWAARMSLLFSIIRMTHPASRLRMVANLTAWFFALCCIGLTIQKQFVCFYSKPTTHKCQSISQLAITQICHSLLVALAWGLLRNARLRKSPCRIIRILFSASILITMAGILNNVFIIEPDYGLAVITVYLQPAVSLIVCDLPVVVTFFYRQFTRAKVTDAGDSYDYATSSSSTASRNTSGASPDNTRGTRGVTRSGPMDSADLTPTILTQPSNTSQQSSTFCSQKAPSFEIP
ncbi:hypothetical protein FIBSPDRAFT_100365 [Athelia psychrophila]|uniref:Integral membrane protein n=1 Tax=Athelia psychrophila TaxID=1759441 RepID=A0A166DIZ7_9AGAM|nr:hypothetical protein FIBSPDRAFT_100365 [Fibularhizoctonia sp. CBS 109695]